MGTFVIDLGVYGEEPTLAGHVKLEEGAGITITPDEAHNSLVIATDVPPGYARDGYALAKSGTGHYCDCEYSLAIV